MKIAVVGSRDFSNEYLVKKIVMNLITNGKMTSYISGGARGVDSWGEEIADEFEINKTIFKPNWNKYGKRAGFLRNQNIIDEADHVIAFWDGKSKGTKHSIDLAVKKGIPIDIYIR